MKQKTTLLLTAPPPSKKEQQHQQKQKRLILPINPLNLSMQQANSHSPHQIMCFPSWKILSAMTLQFIIQLIMIFHRVLVSPSLSPGLLDKIGISFCPSQGLYCACSFICLPKRQKIGNDKYILLDRSEQQKTTEKKAPFHSWQNVLPLLHVSHRSLSICGLIFKWKKHYSISISSNFVC